MEERTRVATRNGIFYNRPGPVVSVSGPHSRVAGPGGRVRILPSSPSGFC